MITDDHLTALAREYAEEMIKGRPSEQLPNCLKNSMLTMNTEYVAEIFQWLLRRFCLVEKAKAKQFFQSRQNILKHQDKYDRYIVDEASAEKRLMLCLFPEIAKEVEGEEMQTVSRTKIEALHSEIHKAIMDAHDADDWQDAAHYILDILPRSFNALFGSKYLPDEKEFAENANCLELKSAEPFKVGDKVKVNKIDDVFNGVIGEIIDINNYGACYVLFPHAQAWFRFSDLEPYTEPKEDHIVEDHDMVKDFDTILKDSFSKERRLNLAAIIAAGVAFNWRTEPQGGSLRDKCQRLVDLSLMVTDTLIAESEKGGSEHGED